MTINSDEKAEGSTTEGKSFVLVDFERNDKRFILHKGKLCHILKLINDIRKGGGGTNAAECKLRWFKVEGNPPNQEIQHESPENFTAFLCQDRHFVPGFPSGIIR